MSKNKKGKAASLNAGKLSPENYIKTQARTLPVVECLITKDWENTGMCNIIIARVHKTGNLTVGIYLLDLYCLGLKDTWYQFNISPLEFKRFKNEDASMEAADYVLLHNIIYGAIAFAEDYGFKPHKDFIISQFILEEDDDNVELMELAFGYDGMPFYMPGPNDTERRVNQIEATLERTAGTGNYRIVYEGKHDDFEDDDELGFDEDEIMKTMDDLHSRSVGILKQLNKIYDLYMRTPDAVEAFEKSPIGANYKLTKEPVSTKFTSFDNADDENHFNKLYQMIIYENALGGAINELQKTIQKHPDKAVFYNLLQTAYAADDQTDNADDMTLKIYKRFPDYLFGKVSYANLLMDMNQFAPVLSIFDDQADLDALYPDREVFHETEASAYYATMCRYFIGVEDIDSADLYMNALLKNDLTDMPGQTITNKVIRQLIDVKMEKLQEAGKMGLE